MSDTLLPINSYWPIKITDNNNISAIKENINEILIKHYSASRIIAFDKVGLDENANDLSNNQYLPNMDFFSNYYKYFYKNNDELCNIKAGEEKGKGRIGKAVSIEIGNYKVLRKEIPDVENRKAGYLSVNFIGKSDDKTDQENASYNIVKFKDHDIGMDGFIAVSGDSFTTQTNIHLILNKILGKKRNNNFIYQYDAYFCNCQKEKDICGIGYNIMEYAKEGDLSKYIDEYFKNNIPYNLLDNNIPYNLLDDKLFEIIRQVLTPLSYLKTNEYMFVHADLKCRNVFVDSNENNIFFKIADYDKSSIFYNGIRFYNKNVKAGYINRSIGIDFPIITDAKYGSYYHLSNSLSFGNSALSWANTYVYDTGIHDNLSTNQLAIMHSPYPMHMSYDVYTFIYSLMREPKVSEHLDKLNKLPRFNKILQKLFHDDDLIKLVEKQKIKNKELQEQLKILHGDQSDIKKYNDTLNKYNNNIERLRSITDINLDLAKEKIKLKVNINDVYQEVGLSIFNNKNFPIHHYKSKYDKYIYLSNNITSNLIGIGESKHICTSICNASKICKTNMYSMETGYISSNTVYKEEGKC